MKISIITPIWNGEPHIAHAANTLFEQTYQDWELVIVDDGSTDKTAELADDLARKDSRIRVFHQKNAGVSVARNRGFDESTGDWVYWLDVDDALRPDALEFIARTVESEPDLNCIQFPYIENTAEFGTRDVIPEAYKQFADKTLSGIEAFRALYVNRETRGQHWQPWRYAYRHDCLPRFRAGIIHEDVDSLPLHLASLAKVRISGTPIYVYELGRIGAVTATFTPRRVWDIFDVTAHLHGQLDAIAAGEAAAQSLPKLNAEDIRGFKAAIAYNLFGFYLAIPAFDKDEQEKLFAVLKEHPEWLLAIDMPRKTAFVKRLMLRLLGIRLTAKLLFKK